MTSEYRRKYRALCVGRGVCCDCGSPNDKKTLRCKGCMDKNTKKYKAVIARCRNVWIKKTKLLVFTHYGGICACCGEDTKEFLTIDHINNDGAEHRRSLGGAANRIYRWLVKNNYPDDFQILCWNCNCAKGIFGKCPHKERK